MYDVRQEGNDEGAKDPASGDAVGAAAQASSSGSEASPSDQEARGGGRVSEAVGSAAEGGEGAQVGTSTYGVSLQVQCHTHRLCVVRRRRQQEVTDAGPTNTRTGGVFACSLSYDVRVTFAQ